MTNPPTNPKHTTVKGLARARRIFRADRDARGVTVPYMPTAIVEKALVDRGWHRGEPTGPGADRWIGPTGHAWELDYAFALAIAAETHTTDPADLDDDERVLRDLVDAVLERDPHTGQLGGGHHRAHPRRPPPAAHHRCLHRPPGHRLPRRDPDRPLAAPRRPRRDRAALPGRRPRPPLTPPTTPTRSSAMTAQTTDTTTTLSAADRVHRALTTEQQTTAQIAEITGLGRSTVGKHLTVLERDLKAVRHPGQQEGGGPRVADGWTKYTSGRLRPGGLDYANEQDQPVGPVAVARALGRSSGAVANCMTRLAKAGDLKQIDSKPRRYCCVVRRSDSQMRKVQA